MNDNLKQLTEEWRATAALWRKQAEEYWPKKIGTKLQPPSRGRSDLINWCNWLCAMADDVDAACAADSEDAR